MPPSRGGCEQGLMPNGRVPLPRDAGHQGSERADSRLGALNGLQMCSRWKRLQPVCRLVEAVCSRPVTRMMTSEVKVTSWISVR